MWKRRAHSQFSQEIELRSQRERPYEAAECYEPGRRFRQVSSSLPRCTSHPASGKESRTMKKCQTLTENSHERRCDNKKSWGFWQDDTTRWWDKSTGTSSQP